MADSSQPPLLEARNLRITFRRGRREFAVVEDMTFSLAAGQTLCLVGESGCGKSVTGNAVLGLLPQGSGRVAGGEILFAGRDLVALSAGEMRRIRAGKISIIFQDHAASLNPAHTIGRQLTESVRTREKVLGRGVSRREAYGESLALLERMGVTSPVWRMRQYPHELSGGMRQRILIGMALAKKPLLLIADEPTTALDVTVQAQILDLMSHLRRAMDTAILFITHDMGVVAEIADFVLVMYAGQMVEYDYAGGIFRNPLHPYTEGLLRSIPQPGRTGERLFAIEGAVPDLENLPPGCRFRERCPYGRPLCARMPPVTQLETKQVRCWRFAPGGEKIEA